MSTNAKEAKHRASWRDRCAPRRDEEARRPAGQVEADAGRDKIRIRRRCQLCGRPRAVYRKFGICRICFRRHGQRRPDPRRPKGDLVTAKGEDTAMMTDPIADMLTRIRNANAIERPLVDMPATKLKVALAQVLQGRGLHPRLPDRQARRSTPRPAQTNSSRGDEPRRAARRPAGLPEVRPRRRAGHPPHRAVLEARPPRLPGLQGPEARARRPGHRHPEHEQGRDARPRRRRRQRSAARFSARCGDRSEARSSG